MRYLTGIWCYLDAPGAVSDRPSGVTWKLLVRSRGGSGSGLAASEEETEPTARSRSMDMVRCQVCREAGPTPSDDSDAGTLLTTDNRTVRPTDSQSVSQTVSQGCRLHDLFLTETELKVI